MDKTTCKILLVDDEKKLADLVVSILKREGYSSIDVAEDCRGAEDNIIRNSYHLILLDVMLPDGNGFELYEKLCQLGYLSEIPVIFLSARDEDTARLRGLGLGADDYITKPFLTKELLLRIAAVLRRTYKLEEGTAILRCGEVVVDIDAGVVKREGKEVSLTSKELALLQVLYRNRGKIVTMDTLCNAMWPEGNYGLESSLIVHMRHLRVHQNPNFLRQYVDLDINWRKTDETKEKRKISVFRRHNTNGICASYFGYFNICNYSFKYTGCSLE